MPWSEEAKSTFLRSQAEAQDAYYRQVYPDAQFLVVTRDGLPIGRLYVVRLHDEIRIIDVALLPEFRGQEIGTALVVGVIRDAAAAGLAVRLHVEPWNPAKRLYERLGFTRVSAGEVYDLMELPAGEGQLKTAS